MLTSVTTSAESNFVMLPTSAVLTMAERTCSAVQSGCRPRTTAAAPARCGEAIDVPAKKAQQPVAPQSSPGTDDRTLTAGATRSGLTRKSTSVGPCDEASYWMSSLPDRK